MPDVRQWTLRRWIGTGSAGAAVVFALALVAGHFAGSPEASTERNTVRAAADTWVAIGDEATNFGAKSYIAIRGFQEAGLLRFQVNVPRGRRVVTAALQLNSGTVPGGGVEIYATKDGWSERHVTWQTAPLPGSFLGTSPLYRTKSWVSWDVTKAVPPAGGQVNLRVESRSAAWMGFMSRESGAHTAPRLVVTTESAEGPVPVRAEASTSPNSQLPSFVTDGRQISGPAGTALVDVPQSKGAAPTAGTTAGAPTASTRSGSQGGATPGSRPGSSGGGGSASTSGVPVPVGDLTYWRQVFWDDFTGSSLGHGWGEYNGTIPSMPGGEWDPSHVDVSDGKLKLLTQNVGGQWTSGGVMNHVQAQTTYGKYEVRFRMDKAPGVKYAILLWPKSGTWPQDGEIDFAEDGGGSRTGTTATVHWGPNQASKEMIQRQLKGDFSQWHTLGVEWYWDKLTYTLDGKAWATVYTKNTPSKPMNLAIQTEAGSCGEWMTCVTSATPKTTTLEVDWVSVYVRK